jgi:two-component system NtrC family sensor kinase
MNVGHVISDVTPDFIIAVRKDEMGKNWILRATIDYEAFNGVVKEVRTGKIGSAFILNRNGQYQAGQLHSINPEKEIFMGSLGIKDRAKGEISIVQRTGDSGHENIYVTTFLKDGDWILVYQQPASEAFSGLKKAKTVALAVILIVSFLIGANAYSLAKRMVRRIAQADKEKQRLNEQMFQTGKLALVGELAAGISHEINNPVAIMVEEAGWIEDLLEEEEFQEAKNLSEFKRALKQIRTQGMRCKEITHKLLSFARKTDSRVQEVQLNELIQDMISFSGKRAKYSGVVINTDIQKDLPPIKVSPSELQQVLLNLINNALDAMEKSGGALSVSAQREDDNFVIKVSDNGPGIPKDTLSQIFDPFFTTKPGDKGTGLGLSICYGIIKKMHGEITVESAVGEGTTFHISLPMKENA